MLFLTLLVLRALSGAEAKAYQFTCPAYPRLFPGMELHGIPTIVDGKRRLVIKRGATEVPEGAFYARGESLFITLNDTSGDTDFVYETNCSSCSFRFGICPGKYRFLGSIASMTMPTDYSNFTVWGAYASTGGVIRVTPPVSLIPRVPDPTMAPTFADPPTIAPTKISAQRYAIAFDVTLNGISAAVALRNLDLLSDTICIYMDYNPERCKVIAAASLTEASISSLGTKVWSVMSGVVNSALPLHWRRGLTDSAAVTILVDLFMYPEWQSPAIFQISTFITDTSAFGYASILRSNSALSALTSTSVVLARKVNNTDTSLYEHSCALDDSLTLYWSLDTATPSKYVRGMLEISGKKWIAGGVVLSEVRTMVHDPNNIVFTYNAETDRSHIFAITSYLATGMEVETQERDFTRIVTVSQRDGKTSLQFEQQQHTGITGDPTLNFSYAAGNNFMWAYGKHFQAGHTPDTRGITKVYWQQGMCEAVEVKESLFPYILLGYASAAILVLTFLVTMSPWKNSKFSHFLKFNKVQWLTTKAKNKCKRYDDPVLVEQHVKAIPKKQLVYNEILSTSIGGAAFVVLFSGAILAFGYFIYLDRLLNYKFDPIRCYSISLAYMGLISLGISLMNATKTKLWQYLINVPIDRAVKFHKYTSMSSMVFLMAHTGLEIWFWGVPLMINLDYTLVVGKAKPLFGFMGMCCFMLVFVTSLPFFRNRYYHRFLGFHSWFVPGVILSIFHFVDLGLLVLGPGMVLYFVDLFLRHLYSWLEPKVVARRLIGYEYIELDVQFHNIFFFYAKNAVKLKNVTTELVTPSSWYYVCVPEVKSNEWHPLTVVGFSGNKIKFLVRRRNDGGWTENLYTRIFADLPVSVRMRGPYGSLQIDIYNPKYKELFFIAGGVGAAVVQSMVEALIFYYTNYVVEDGFVPDIKLIIVSQNRSLYEFINKRLEYYSTLKRPRITLDLYWTSKYMKYLQEEEKGDGFAATENQMSNPTLKPFEIKTQSIVKQPGEEALSVNDDAPADGYVSESYNSFSVKSPSKVVVSSSTPMNNGSPQRNEESSFKTPTRSDASEAKSQSSTKSRKSAKKREMADDDNFRLNTESIESESTPTEKPAKKGKSSKRKSGKRKDDDDDFRISAGSIDNVSSSPMTTPSSSKKPSKSPSKKSSRSAKIHMDNDSIDQGGDSASKAEDSIKTPQSSNSKKSKSIVNATDEAGVVRSSTKLEQAKMLSPSNIKTQLEDMDGHDLSEPSLENGGAAVHPLPVLLERAQSKHIKFDPVPEPPKSKIEDFIVYEHFYENILKKGRPNIENIILNGINGEFSSGSRGTATFDFSDEGGVYSNRAVIVCAPPSLIASTRAVCSMYNIDMHEQIFDYN